MWDIMINTSNSNTSKTLISYTLSNITCKEEMRDTFLTISTHNYKLDPIKIPLLIKLSLVVTLLRKTFHAKC